MTKENAADYAITIGNVLYAAPQRYYGTRILFVVNGSAGVSVNGEQHLMEAGDILFINRNDHYTVRGSTDNNIVCLSIPSHFFVMHYPHYFHYDFVCFSKELDPGRGDVVAKLRRMLSELVIVHSRNEEGSLLEAQSLLFQLLLLVTRYFKTERPHMDAGEASDERIARIIQKMELRYADPLTLAEMAESEYLSSAYLSRYFKQTTGMGFLQYLKMVRLKHCVEDLLYTSDNLSQIALKNGFSTAKNFTEAFRSVYDQTPVQYRKEHRQENSAAFASMPEKLAAGKEPEAPETLMQLTRYLEEASDQRALPNEAPSEDCRITIAKGETATALAREKHILFIGELNELLNQQVKEQVILAKQQIRVDYVGVRNLIGGSTLLPEVETDEFISTTPKYANADLAMQFMKEQGIGLFLRIAYTEVIRNEDRYFLELERFLVHALQAFGREFVNRWQLLFHAEKETAVLATELERIYLRLHASIRKYAQQVKIGTFLPFKEEKESLGLAHQWQFQQSDRIDFITYDADQNEVVDFSEISDEDFQSSQDYIIGKTRKLKRFLKKHHMPQPIYLENWNTLTGNTRYTNGTFFRGALILKTVLDLSAEVAGLGFWLNSEIHGKNGGTRNPTVSGLELFHFFNGKRPAFYTMLFKERMTGEVCAEGENYVLTRNEDGYRLLLFNEKHFNPRYSVDALFMRNRSQELHVRLLGMEPGEYQVRKYLFDQQNGGLYTKWGQLNSKHGIDLEVMDYIVQSSRPTLEIEDERIDADWSFYASMSSNAIMLIEFRRAIGGSEQ